jgi:hypothetical protein
MGPAKLMPRALVLRLSFRWPATAQRVDQEVTVSTSTQRRLLRSPGPYSVYPLQALDGVLAYVALDGETVAFCFGPDERAAAEAVAAHVTESVLRSQDGARP